MRDWRYADQRIELAQGDEMGRFLLGSTVVMLMPKGPLAWNPAWAPAGAVCLGEGLATEPALVAPAPPAAPA